MPISTRSSDGGSSDSSDRKSKKIVSFLPPSVKSVGSKKYSNCSETIGRLSAFLRGQREGTKGRGTKEGTKGGDKDKGQRQRAKTKAKTKGTFYFALDK
jgi:hypothetical protein